MAVGVIIEKDGDRLLLRAAQGDPYPVTEETAYRVLMEIVNDTSLPKMQQVRPDAANVEEAVRRAADILLPEPLRPLATFGMKNASTKLRGNNRRIRRGGRCRR